MKQQATDYSDECPLVLIVLHDIDERTDDVEDIQHNSDDDDDNETVLQSTPHRHKSTRRATTLNQIVQFSNSSF